MLKLLLLHFAIMFLGSLIVLTVKDALLFATITTTLVPFLAMLKR